MQVSESWESQLRFRLGGIPMHISESWEDGGGGD